ncbi:MAG: hypothetical protein VR65_01835 [Desulfobulbaceae bacterium BRH_c16a]|nr:MAG: hypothetical protein VR65_01835 [Desulfobulbaceae bacterium BRH_c16a]
MPEFYQFHLPTKVLYGPGIAFDFSHELAGFGIRRYFLVTDRVLHNLGISARIADRLKEDGYEIPGSYIDVPQDASVACVEEIARQARLAGAEGLLAVGGGSVIDAAKAANCIFSKGGRLVEDYSGVSTLSEPLKPLIVIPTTAGTGSECTLAAVIYDQENATKLAFSDRFLLPNLAVLDPQITASMPPLLTAATGMDALTHAIEAYVSVDASPHSQALGQVAIELITNNIIRAVEDGNDLEARGAMLIGANLAGISFSHSMVGCVHSMAHATGGMARVPHGIANAILLPHGMDYNMNACKHLYVRLARYLGGTRDVPDSDSSARTAICRVKELTKELNRLCGLPLRLRDVGVTEGMLPLIAKKAEEDGTAIYNPRLVTAEDIIVSLESAF